MHRSDLNIIWGNCICGIRLCYYQANKFYYKVSNEMHLAHEVFAGIYGEDIDENFIFHMRSLLAYASNMYLLDNQITIEVVTK